MTFIRRIFALYLDRVTARLLHHVLELPCEELALTCSNFQPMDSGLLTFCHNPSTSWLSMDTFWSKNFVILERQQSMVVKSGT